MNKSSATNLSKSTSEFTNIYENMRGVSFNGDQCGSENGRFSYLENMYVDYEGDGDAIESIPGFRELYSFGKRINGVYLQSIGDGREYVIVHAAESLYRFEKGERDSLTSLTSIATVADERSCAFTFGRDVFLLDGQNMHRISEDGSFCTLGDEGFKPYVPLLYRNGKECEDRNLLTNEGREIYNVSSYDPYIYGHPGLKFGYFDYDNRTCSVVGIDNDITDAWNGLIAIPKYCTLDGIRYTVTRIEDHAFEGNKYITDLYTHDGLLYIGKYAFFNCTNLKYIRPADSVIEIDDYAFFGCTKARAIYIGKGLERVGIAFVGGNMQPLFWLNGEYDRIYEIENYDILMQYEHPDDPDKYINSIVPDTPWNNTFFCFPVHYPIKSIKHIKSNGVIIPQIYLDKYFLFPNYDPVRRIVYFALYHPYPVENCEIEIVFEMEEQSFTPEGSGRDIFTVPLADNFSCGDGIFGCKCSASFDGRIFLSGNSSLGGVVFYSALTESGAALPTYFGSRSFLLDGLGDYKVTSLMATSDSLAVFKSHDGGEGSIYYHTIGSGKDKYPVSEVYGGAGRLGESYRFFDDALFLCERGLCAIEKSNSQSFRNIKCRSNGVNAELLCEDVDKISVAQWCGYLVLCAEGRMYLADSRDTFRGNENTEYEWYYLNGIGIYKNDYAVYRYCSVAQSGYNVHPLTDQKTDSTVYSIKDENGDFVYYTIERGIKYEVYPTGERAGGEFRPATKVIGCGELLIFFTDEGDMCVFNNDMRGVAPSRIRESADFSAEDYASVMGNRIHPDFYSFASHAVHYELSTPKDDCGVPHLTKSSVRSSLVIKCKSLAAGELVCCIVTDARGTQERARLTPSKMSFDSLDFSALAFTTDDFLIIPVRDGERGWIYKQITLYEDGFCSPIGVYSISYRYKIKGKIRKN